MATPSPRDEFAGWCAELLAPLGPVRVRRMFGGHGLYVDEVFVALIAGDTLYLKTDDLSRPAFEAAGGHAFEYTGADGRHAVMSYWTVPAEAMESPAQMQPWARQALASALRARASNPPARPRAPRASASAAAATPARQKRPTQG
ncbi:TfoX/Sxy family protein [Ideonella sp.]|uniref:TfoX/Sxy family protein n=1 Tax=Ideonella sp. TaxID=1929293 RepID=UPI0035B332A9